jgi:predicted permease
MTRVLRPLFTRTNRAANLTIVLLLSFGFGAAALLSAALDRFLLHPLAVPHPETLVCAIERHPPVTNSEWFSYSMYEAMGTMRTLNGTAAASTFDSAVSLHDGAHEDVRPILVEMVSGNYFSMLGASAATGRTLGPSDEHPGSAGVPVVLSHRFWTRAFANSRSILGATLIIQGKPFVIAGIMSKSFFGTRIDESPDVWLPLGAQPLLSNKSLTDPDPDRHFAILARLQPGVVLAQAQQEFGSVYRAIHRREDANDTGAQGSLVPIADTTFALRDPFRHALTLLVWGLGALLLMMCANVGGLLLARTARRQRDTSVRIALGASRTRLLTAPLLESAALGLAGGCGGLALAFLGAPLFVRLLPLGTNASPVSLAPNFSVALVALGLALLLSIFFGAVPAWLTSRAMPQHALRRGASTSRSSTLSRALLALQTALTLVLLVEAGLMLRTFSALRHTDPGFDADHLVVFTLVPGLSGPNAHSMLPDLPPGLREDLLDRVQHLPGVRGASLAGAALMERIGFKTSAAVAGQVIATSSFLNTSLNIVSSNFFDTMSMPILDGRSLTSADSIDKPPAPVVINEAFARNFFPGQNPIGKTFGSGAPGQTAGADDRVVGIVGDSKYRSLREPLLPIFYSPMQLRTYEGTQQLYVRTLGPPEQIIAAVRNTLTQLDPRLPFSEIVTMREQVSASLWQERLLAVLAAVFSVVSILMAATGLYGLLAYDVAQRTREFGIRIAVGAQRGSVAALLLRDLLRIALPGAAAGVLLCVMLSRLVASSLYGVRPSDPVSFTAALLLVGAIAAAASFLPVWRTVHINPAAILRDE